MDDFTELLKVYQEKCTKCDELQERCNKWFERARMHRSKEKALQKVLAVWEELVTKLNLECTELHQRIMTLGRTAEVRIDEMTKRLHDKDESVTKLQERNGVLTSVLDMKSETLAATRARLNEEIGYYQDLKAKLQDQAKALSEANDRIATLVELREFDRQYQDRLRAKIKRLEEEAVVAQGGFDYFVEEKKDLEGIVATLRELRDCDQKQAVAGTEDVEALKKELKDLGKYFKTTKEGRDYWFKEYQCVANRNQVIETKLEAN